MSRYRSATKCGDYDHLNVDPVSIKLCIPEIAALVHKENYGTHRFLSAIVKIRLAKDPEDILGRGLKDLLDSGAY